MKKWQIEAIRRIDLAAKNMKKQVLTTPDNKYNRVSGEIDIWLTNSTGNNQFTLKIYQHL